MPDWKQFVRERLKLTKLAPSREAEIVEDVAGQLEEAYREALRRGAAEAEACIAAEQHIPDWKAFVTEIVQNERRSLPPAEQRALNHIEARKHEAKGWTFMFADLLSDVVYAIRQIRANPGFALVVVLTLALGIGANSAIFSLVDGVMLRPVPVEQPEQLFGVAVSDSHTEYPHGFSYRDFLDYREMKDVLAGLTLYSPEQVAVTTGGQSQVAWGIACSGDYFDVVRARPLLGRTFSAEEGFVPTAPLTVVLSYEYWQRRFGGDPNAVGSSIKVNGEPATVIGVAARDFAGLESIYSPEIYVPFVKLAGKTSLEDRNAHGSRTWARIKPGVTPEQLEAAFNVRSEQLAKEYPATNKNVKVRVFPSWEARFEPGTGGLLKPASLILFFVVGAVLLIACANVANLLLARATGVQREVAVRIALGASRNRLVRQFLVESAVLSVLGALAACLMAYWSAASLSSIRPIPGTPVGFDIRVDTRVLIVTGVVALLTSILFGLIPALRATNPELVPSLKGEETTLGKSGRKFSMRNILVVGQVALSIVLLVSAGLFLRSLRLGQQTDMGIRKDGALVATFDVGLRNYDEARGRAYSRDLLARVRALPGVESATLAAPLPLDYNTGFSEVIVDGRQVAPEKEKIGVMTSRVEPGYFEVMGTRLLEGRGFTEADAEGAPKVAIVNQRMAQTYWPGQSVIGKRIRLSQRDSDPWEIVGVAQNGKYRLYFEPPLDYLYLPLRQSYRSTASIIAVTKGDPASLAAPIRREAAALDPDLPLFAVRTMKEFMDARFGLPVLFSSLLTVFGAMGLTLAGVGIYGVMAYSVGRRTREIGVRMALGAPPSRVLGLVLTQGMKLTLIGLALGVLLALGAGRALNAMLFGVSGSDPITFLGISVLLASVAILACYIPARRAAKVDPLVALRQE